VLAADVAFEAWDISGTSSRRGRLDPAPMAG
jgi:hypothetical protein